MIQESSQLEKCFVLIQESSLRFIVGYWNVESARKLTTGLEERWKRFFEPQLMILAVALDPSQKLRPLRQDAVSWLDIIIWASHYFRRWFKTNACQLESAVVRYKDEMPPFLSSTCKSFEHNPLNFWRLLTDKTSGIGDLARVAVFLYEICPHAAHIERLWSMMDGIHTKSRNRLAMEKVMSAASVKLEIVRDRNRAKAEDKCVKEFVSDAHEWTADDSGTEAVLMDGDAEGGEDDGGPNVATALQEIQLLEDGPSEVLEWLDNNAEVDLFDRFVTLKELYGLD